jgi:hypothetical protein
MAMQSPLRYARKAFSAIRGLDRISNSNDEKLLPTNPLSQAKRSESLTEAPFDIDQLLDEVRGTSSTETVLYLAYGSNLSAKTFKGTRGIKPISQVNVLVPELELTFDLPGIPYTEPCFANTRYRPHAHSADYHKDRWHKGLVGVVYEVTKADYATIIATEGGGASYQDIIVLCYEIPPESKVVDPHPTGSPFKAHTLLSPPSPPGTPLSRSGSIQRPDPSYAQPSARYLKLITDGAEEHDLPTEYRSFLHELRPYTITSMRQRLGQSMFLSIWMPIIISLFMTGKLFAGADGRHPKWLANTLGFVFRGVWVSYDVFFKRVFGDGERTQKRENGEDPL